MHLVSLKVENFKNCSSALLEAKTSVLCFTGSNGAGKTNMLDAIYYLCSGKSYFNHLDQQLIKEGEEYFTLRGKISKGGATDEILCALIRGKKKVIKRNDVLYERFIDHYGEYPAIMVSPGDINIIMGGSDERRKWIDSTISLHDHDYLLALIKYDKVLKQRNAELKKLAGKEKPEKQLLEVYDTMLEPLAKEIHDKRKSFVHDFLPIFLKFQETISGNAENVELIYESNLNRSSLTQLLSKSFRKDLALQHTTEGTHRDDLEFTIEKNPLKKFGSQGQQKTFLLALKLAQHQYISLKKNIKPVLLLDDICERLDEDRLKQLFQLLSGNEFGQIFITDTSAGRIKEVLDNAHLNATFYEVKNGILTLQAA